MEFDDLELSCSSSDFEHNEENEDPMTVTINTKNNSVVNTQPYQFEPEAEGTTQGAYNLLGTTAGVESEKASAPTDQDERLGNNHWFVSMFSCLFVARSRLDISRFRSRSKL